VDRLAAELGISWETVVNRISQLDSGLPVHFIKMDWRGVVLKRSSYSGLQFAPLYMRVCGRWASARSLIAWPGSIFRQYSVFPDLAGQTFFCVGRSVRAPQMAFGAAPLVYSLTLGVQARDAHRLIYAQDFTNPPVECGVTCRLCTVLNCENRVCPSASQPAMGKFDFDVIWSGKTIHERIPTDQ
jgi:predicted transcriptional regulator